MRATSTLIPTLKETPADADVASHIMLLRAGCIRRVASGLYSWLPLGVRVLRKVETIVREELDRSGAQEVALPIVQPAELWRESGRWEVMGPEMLRMRDRNDRDYALSPTHEEMITDLVRRVIDSYKQFPCNLYQIQTKFRDEIRPRFGLMRAREFVMKDGYSFHLDESSFESTYQEMHGCYSRILQRIGLEFRAVQADPGLMGDGDSHEFQVLADSGEDLIAFSPASDYAANVEQAEAAASGPPPAPGAALEKVPTPGQHSIDDVSVFLDVDPASTVKTLIVRGTDTPLVALVLRGDKVLNETKAGRLPAVHAPLEFADDADITSTIGARPGSLGPIGLELPTFVDHSATALADFVCGANEDGFHYRGANWERDVPAPNAVDIRNVEAGDPAIDGSGPLQLTRGIEAGHIFKLGDKYSAPMKFAVQDRSGAEVNPVMGCYGLGVTRLVAAIVEQCHDDDGIVWPESVAPFALHIVALNYGKSEVVRLAADGLYRTCLDAGVEVLIDDRDERPGVKFADADLIGLPHRVTVGERSLKEGKVEYRRRRDSDAELIEIAEVTQRLSN